MIRHVIVTIAVIGLAASAASAQEPRVELSATAGWTFSDGVSGDPVVAGDGNVYNRLDPKDAFSWSASLGFNVTPNVEAGFLFGHQLSELELGGTATRTVGDLSVLNYHGYLAYNFGESDAKVRPFVLGGIGATHYGAVGYSVAGRQGETEGQTKFSTTWAAGVKVFPNPRFGLKLQARWTPTYIKSDAAGWWCDPFWGCYVVGDAQYSNQFELGGGITLRF